MTKSNMSLGGALFLIAFILVMMGGYITNIIKIFGLFGDEIGAELVIRGIGIFMPPFGAIAGFF